MFVTARSVLLLWIAVNLSGCQVDVATVLGRSDSWTIVLYKDGRIERKETVGRDSPRQAKLLEWAKRNSDGWSFSAVVDVPSLYVYSRSFGLNIRDGRIVLSADNRQYAKNISSDEYSMLRQILAD